MPASLFYPCLLLALSGLPPDVPAEAQILATHPQNRHRPVQPVATLVIWGWLNSFCLKSLKDVLNFIRTTTGSIFIYKTNLLIQQIKAPISKTLNGLRNGSARVVH